VRALHTDRSGLVWVYSNGGGLNKFDPQTENFTHYRHDPAGNGKAEIRPDTCHGNYCGISKTVDMEGSCGCPVRHTSNHMHDICHHHRCKDIKLFPRRNRCAAGHRRCCDRPRAAPAGYYGHYPSGIHHINVLHAQASAWFAKNGLTEEAIKYALAGGDAAAAGRLVAQHGFNLVSEENWITLQRWLNLLPEDILSQDPALVLPVTWTHLVNSREAELVSSLDRAEALLSARSHPAAATRHLLGHLEVMRGRQYFFSAEAERAIIHVDKMVASSLPVTNSFLQTISAFPFPPFLSPYNLVSQSPNTLLIPHFMIKNHIKH